MGLPAGPVVMALLCWARPAAGSFSRRSARSAPRLGGQPRVVQKAFSAKRASGKTHFQHDKIETP